VARARGDHELADRLQSAAERVRTSIGGLRSLLVDIYPPSLHSAGLAAAIREMATAELGSGPRLDLALDDQAADQLTAEQQEGLFRIAQEAIRNAVRHAQADVVAVTLGEDDDGVVMEIADDGIGLPGGEPLSSPHGHLGLTVMRDTAARIGAALQLADRSEWGADRPDRPGTQWRITVRP